MNSTIKVQKGFSTNIVQYISSTRIVIRSRSSGALMVEVWICTTMALQNLKQYGCQTGNKLKEKSRDLNRNSSRNKNETMFGSGYENCPEFGVLSLIFCKQEEKLLFFGSVSGCTCLIL